MTADAKLPSPYRPDPEFIPAIRALSLRIIEAARPAAQVHGYALAAHGSLERDVDLLACPWTDDAAEPDVLVEAIRAAVEEALGDSWFNHGVGANGVKPHGRRAYVLTGFGVVETRKGCFPFIDLSVIPRKVTT